MKILEVTDAYDAAERLRDFFGDVTYNDQYSQMLALLCDAGRFREGLDEVSRLIWHAYNRPEIRSSRNRFARAILHVAANFGFVCQDNVVLTAQTNPTAFGNRIRDGVLWKDSFALGHGEYAHSYQLRMSTVIDGDAFRKIEGN
jgi:hypothetical protein